MKTMKISQLIWLLKECIKSGDKPIALSVDPEGNEYGTLNLVTSFGVSNGIFIIYPHNEHLELSEINGYIEEKGAE